MILHNDFVRISREIEIARYLCCQPEKGVSPLEHKLARTFFVLSSIYFSHYFFAKNTHRFKRQIHHLV